MNRRLASSLLHAPLRIGFTLALAIAGCDGDPGPTDAGGGDAAMDAGPGDAGSPSALTFAINGIGGEAALLAMRSFRYETSGTRRFSNEGVEPGEFADLATYTATYTHDVVSGALRFDMEKQAVFEATQFFPPASFGIVVVDGVGGLDAQAGFQPAGPVPSQLVGAFQQQFRLFNPHLYLLDALDDDTGVSDGGTEMVDSVEHRVVAIQTDVVEVRLFVDASTGLISRLVTMENNQLNRDVSVEVEYSNWSAVDGVSFPSNVEISVNGGVVHTQSRTTIGINPMLDSDTFDLPPEAGMPSVDSEAFEWGTHTHNGIDEFFHLGFFYGPVPPTVIELAPNLQLLAGGWSSLVVKVGDDLVILEAPTSPEFGEELVTQAETLFPGFSVTHVVPTHFHQDHAAGVRGVVASGATLVIPSRIRGFWDTTLAAPSTVRPDLLATMPRTPAFQEIAEGGTWNLEAGGVALSVHHIPTNPHAADMVLTEIDAGGQKFVFVGDLYNAAGGGTLVLGGPESLFDAMRSLGIIDASCSAATPLTIVPTHGVPQSLADSLAELSMQGIEVGCP